MDKAKLTEYIIKSLENDLEVLKEAERANRESATHEESKPENEYDTRGLEASYLAGAQSKRITETEEVLGLFRHVKPRNFAGTDAIAVTALIEVEFNGKRSFYYMMQKGGGVNVIFEGKKIQVITPSSPLGGVLLGLKAGASAVVENAQQILEYEVISVQ